MGTSRKKPETEPETGVKVGDTVKLDGPAGFVALPDGTVVTARMEYVVRHAGEHRVSGVTGVEDRSFHAVQRD